MDEFMRIGAQEIKEKKGSKTKKKNSVDKKRLTRLKKSFLPYWAREIEYASKKENDLNSNQKVVQ